MFSLTSCKRPKEKTLTSHHAHHSSAVLLLFAYFMYHVAPTYYISCTSIKLSWKRVSLFHITSSQCCWASHLRRAAASAVPAVSVSVRCSRDTRRKRSNCIIGHQVTEGGGIYFGVEMAGGQSDQKSNGQNAV